MKHLSFQTWGVDMSAIIFEAEDDQIEIFEKATSRRWIRSKRARIRRKEIKQIRDKVIARYYSRLKHLRQKHQKISARQHHSTESDFRA